MSNAILHAEERVLRDDSVTVFKPPAKWRIGTLAFGITFVILVLLILALSLTKEMHEYVESLGLLLMIAGVCLGVVCQQSRMSRFQFVSPDRFSVERYMKSHYCYEKINKEAQSYSHDRLAHSVERFRLGVITEDDIINRFMPLFACDNHAIIDDFLSVLSREEMESIGKNLVTSRLDYVEGFCCAWLGKGIEGEDRNVFDSRISKAINYYSDRVKQLLSSDSAERAAEQFH